MLKTRTGKVQSWLSVIVLVAMIGLLAGCGSNTQSSATNAKKTYVIHAILSETGDNAFYGKKEARSLEILQKQVNATGGINGTPVKFDIADNESDAATSVALASKILATNPQVLIVGSGVAMEAPVDKLATAKGPVIYDQSPGIHPAPHSFIYSAAPSTLAEMQAIMNFLKTKGWTHVAVITTTDGMGQDGWEQFQKALALPQNQGKIDLVDHETFDDSAVNVSAQLTKISAAKPQAIIVWSDGTPVATVFKAMVQSGLQNLPTFTTSGNEDFDQMHSYAGFLPKELYFPSAQFIAANDLPPGPAKTAAQNFIQAYASQSIKVDNFDAELWDAGNIMIYALEKLGVNATAAQIRQYIDHDMEGYVGVFGPYHFSPTDHRGLGVSGLWMARWDPSKDNWVTVSGAGGLGTP